MAASTRGGYTEHRAQQREKIERLQHLRRLAEQSRGKGDSSKDLKVSLEIRKLEKELNIPNKK